jgi:lysine 2,3-aminomutase
MIPDHPKLTLDSLHEEADSPVKGLVHRYPDKALYLRLSHPPPPLFSHLLPPHSALTH